MLKNINNNLKNKFVKDTIWLLISYLILGICGIGVNILLTNHFATEGFGIFSIALRIYLIISMIATLGINASVLKTVAQNKDNQTEYTKATNSGWQLSLFVSTIIVLLAFLIIYLLPAYLLNQEVINCIKSLLITIPIFSINKVFTAYLNGLRKIKIYSFIQSFRWLSLMFLILLFVNWKLDLPIICLVFPITEILILICCLIAMKNDFNFSLKPLKNWYKTHSNYGIKLMFSNTIIDLFNYVDTLMIGYFMDLKWVGIYSFASEISKNLLVLANVIQVNINPVIADLWHKSKFNQLLEELKKIKNITLLVYMPIVFFASVFYYFFIKFYYSNEMMESVIPFCILGFGILCLSVYKPMQSINELAGFPQDSLVLNSIVLVINIILNFVFIKYWGIIGVAIATAISYICSAILIIYFAKFRLKLDLINFKKE